MELELEPLNFPSDQERPCIIAGPCSAETEEQVYQTRRFRGKWRGCFTLDEAGKGRDWYAHCYRGGYS